MALVVMLFFVMFFLSHQKEPKNGPQTGGISCRMLSRVFCEMICGSAFGRYIASIVVGVRKRAYTPLQQPRHSLTTAPQILSSIHSSQLGIVFFHPRAPAAASGQ